MSTIQYGGITVETALISSYSVALHPDNEHLQISITLHGTPTEVVILDRLPGTDVTAVSLALSDRVALGEPFAIENLFALSAPLAV